MIKRERKKNFNHPYLLEWQQEKTHRWDTKRLVWSLSLLDYSIPQILGEAIGYVKYKNDASMMYNVMDRPASTYHNNTLEWKKWF